MIKKILSAFSWIHTMFFIHRPWVLSYACAALTLHIVRLPLLLLLSQEIGTTGRMHDDRALTVLSSHDRINSTLDRGYAALLSRKIVRISPQKWTSHDFVRRYCSIPTKPSNLFEDSDRMTVVLQSQSDAR